MRQLMILFTCLLLITGGMWTLKSRTPENRPNSYADGLNDGNFWWNSMDPDAAPKASTAWVLDPEIPSNYIPVPGRTELYMVVDKDGYITAYRRRVKQDDGSWLWEDCNPDVPENYEPVPGLKDVYKVTYDDGSVKYFKYIRNKDDTYAFVEVDARGNMIGYENPKGDEIPENYERVNRNQYAVKDGNGVTVGYKERVPATDGSVVWINIDEPDMSVPEMSDIGFNLTTDVTGAGDTTGGVRPMNGYTTGSASSSMNMGQDSVAIPTLMPSGYTSSQTHTSTTVYTGGGGGGQGGQTFVFTQPVISQSETYYITPPPGMDQALQPQQGMDIGSIDWNAGGNPSLTPPPGTEIGTVITAPPVPGSQMAEQTFSPGGLDVTLPTWQPGQGGGNGGEAYPALTMPPDATLGPQPTLPPSEQGQQPEWQMEDQPSMQTMVPGGQSALPTMPPNQGGNGSQGGNGGGSGQPMATMYIPAVQTLPPNDSSDWSQYMMTPNPYQQMPDFATQQPFDVNQFFSQGENGTTVTENGGGYYTETEVIYDTVTEGSDKVTYAVSVERRYDASGNLLSTYKADPVEVAREQGTGGTGTAIAGSLSEEQARMVANLGSVGAQYNAGVPNDMVTLLNDARMQSGLGTLSFTGSSRAYSIALCRSAMMAMNSTGNNNLPGYGSLTEMCAMYGISASSPSENMWVCNAGTSAEAIHNALQNTSAYNTRMDSGYTEVAVAIVEKDGKYYIDEVFLK